jgi:hypothetical protein
MFKRMFYASAAILCLASTPCAADHVLVWTAPANFPGAVPSLGPIGPAGTYLGDFDGDSNLEIVLQPAWNNLSLLEVRDFATGALEGTLDLAACCGGFAKGIHVYSPYGIPYILVLMGSVSNADQNLIAVFKWANPTSVANQRTEGDATTSRPNPFRQQTTITFALTTPGNVELHIFDLAGRVIRKVKAGQLAVGSHEVGWDGTDEAQKRLAAGTYFYALVVDGATVSAQKTVLLH